MKWMLASCIFTALLCSVAGEDSDSIKVINKADMSWSCPDGTTFRQETINKAIERSAQRWFDGDFQKWNNKLYPHKFEISKIERWDPNPTTSRGEWCNAFQNVVTYPILAGNDYPPGKYRVLISTARTSRDKTPGPGKTYTYSFCGVASHFERRDPDKYEMCRESWSLDQPLNQVQLP